VEFSAGNSHPYVFREALLRTQCQWVGLFYTQPFRPIAGTQLSVDDSVDDFNR
jgi:hypothetical protein